MPEEKVSSSSHTTTNTGGGNGFLYFAIGALIIAVGVLGWMFYDGGWRTDRSADGALERSADAIGDAARTIPTPTPPQPQPQPEPSPAPTTPPATPPG